MTSRTSSPSEGEILESDSEKATTSLPSVNGISVDRQSRKRVSVSRSPSPIRSPRPRQSRTRSRSPYREPRGTKRPRDDHFDRTDSRRFKVHYEERLRNERSKDSAPHNHVDRGNAKDSYLRHDMKGPGKRSRDKRPRTRSRSPGRASGKRPQIDRYENRKGDSRSGGYTGRGRDNNGYRESRGRLSREQSVSDRGYPPVAAASSRREAELRTHQTQHNDSSRSEERHTTDMVSVDATTTVTEPVIVDTPPLDEASLMEARRKKREAIKAKYKGQETPMLVQALALNSDSTPQSPVTESPMPPTKSSGSSKHSPSQTLKDTSGQESPPTFELGKDEDLANDNARLTEDLQEDEPSAADYDPTMDMQEDKIRHDQRQQENEVSSSAYDETQNLKQDILIPNHITEPSIPKKIKNEFDMFADEEDDDMFAEAPAVVRRRDVGEDSARAIPIPRAKALDMSMLDDWDDEEGYYKVIFGELLDGRYHVQSNLGKGMFSGVVRAMDQTNKSLVAIKLIRSNETMKKAGLKEIEILVKLAHADPEDKKHMIRLERYFEHKGHLCMVFENLSINLREVLKKFGRDVGINLKAVRAYAQQMFLGLSLMRKCNILHADLKPDNVLVNESRNMLKICDLGSASDASENEITPYLVSRFYRAPEIMLGMPYDFGIDVWSIGCTLFELYTGKILFTGRTNNQMLRSIMECRGKFNHKILRKAQFSGFHFDDLLNFRSVEKDKLSGKDIVRILPFTKPTRDLRTRLGANTKGMSDTESKELNLFVDLLDRCLNLNPEKRCTASEALKHPFIMRKV